MTYQLNALEMKALKKAESETGLMKSLGGEFFNPADLGLGIGKGTIASLCDLGLLERGYSEYHREPNYLRITEDGERCVNGGYTTAEIVAICEADGTSYRHPRVLTWPVTNYGDFR